MKSLGDRIKKYEMVARNYATRRLPVMVRVDGRSFHTYTRPFNRPFDERLQLSMVDAARAVAEDMQGFKAAYIQSDEATFCITDYDNLDTDGWFDYEFPKIISITASMMAVNFYDALRKRTTPSVMPTKLPTFDSRAFSIPKEDVVNAFVWRAKDWERNSLQMYAHSIFSHKQLHGMNKAAMHEMLHSKKCNWTTDLTCRQRNGTFLIKTDNGIIEDTTILPTFTAINEKIGELFL